MSRRWRIFEQEEPLSGLVRVTVVQDERLVEQVTERPGTNWRSRYRSNRCTTDAGAVEMYRSWCAALRPSLRLVLTSEGDEADPREAPRNAVPETYVAADGVSGTIRP